MVGVAREKRIRNNIIFSGIVVLLFFIPFLHISVRGLPYVYNDEFGYWASAAWFTGKDWSGIISNIPYYSYGYGVILSLIIRITGSMSRAYKIAIALNGVWLAFGFCFLYRTGEEIYSDIDKTHLALAALAATVFSSNIVEVNYSWPEVFLFFLFCFLFYFVVLVIKRPSVAKMILLAVILGYSFYVHQRTLGIIVSVCISMGLLLIFKKISLRQILGFIIPFVICMIIGAIIKRSVITEIWNSADIVHGNDFQGQIGTIISIFSLIGIWKLLLSFLGKLYYVFASTFFLVPFAIYMIIMRCIVQKKDNRTIDDYFFAGIFLILAFIFTMGINSIFMINPHNVTHIVYGRYTDNIFGPFLLIAIIEFFKHKVSIKENIAGIVIFVGLSGSVYYALKLYGVQIQAAINNAGIAYLVENDGIELVKGCVIVIGVWIFLQILNQFIKNRRIAVLSISIFLIALFFAIGQKTYKKFELDWSDAAKSSEKYAAIIKDICEENEDVEIYAVNGGPANFPWLYAGNGIQFLLGDKIVYNVTLEEAMKMAWPDNVVVLASCVLVEAEGLSEVSSDTVYRLFVSDNIAQ